MCNRCEKVVHANTLCSGLSAKQVAALRAADSLEWTCHECADNTPKRKSIIIPEEDDDEDTELNLKSAPVDIKRLLQDVSKEVQKTFRNELKEVNTALQYCSDKIDDFSQFMDAFKEKIKELEKSNTAIKNKNANLELKIGALEQRVNDLEQEKLTNQMEISNIPNTENEDTSKIIKDISDKLNLNTNEVRVIKRVPTREGRSGLIKVEMISQEARDGWVDAARKKKLIVADIVQSAPQEVGQMKVFIREALTQHRKMLLWTTKQELQNTHKYIWCKNGNILVRKEDQGKVITIRSAEDIKKLQT